MDSADSRVSTCSWNWLAAIVDRKITYEVVR